MKISVDSNVKIQKSFLLNLYNERIDFVIDKDFDLPDGWYELNLPYTGTKTEISDIKINGETIKWPIYTGWYIDGNGTRHQPATAMWDNGGVFKIWLHTNISVFIERTLTEIHHKDFGKDLSKDYTFTVDRPLRLKRQWPESVQRFFTTGDGPHWWKLGTQYTPYRILDLDLPPVEKILEECNRICEHKWTFHNDAVEVKSISPNDNELPFCDMSVYDVPYLKNLIKQIGYTNILEMGISRMSPGAYLPMHRGTENYDKKSYPYTKGCKKFYWALTEYKDWYFKLGKSGIIPLENPCLINTTEHVHSVINERDENLPDRWIFSIYGELPDDK